MVTDAMHDLVLVHGTADITLRSVAEHLRLTTAGLLYHTPSRTRMVSDAAAVYGARWLDWLAPRMRWEGIGGALPREPRELEGATVWLAFGALARSMPPVAGAVAGIERREAQLVAQALSNGPERLRVEARRTGRPDPPRSPPLPPASFIALRAGIRGLRLAMTEPGEPLPATHGVAVLDALLAGVGLATVPSDDPAGPDVGQPDAAS